ncbi:GH1 family beta-glucosidase [Massilia sp. YIM B02443]|uniref:GH1 family beta-glucosidase n=1 Tax=Massilia sp. YIM B02443 TaxID=3050127 RepID=UPI0025B72A7F|nr:GH1 family beta-glucosidase [Massilia sp. YIM B02443]MDN4037988.1 GH1 family beta-glucosidase [Massilia sp. YIM B02443]
MTTANRHQRPESAAPSPAPQRSDFASDFLWGCATSSYQIEGAGREDGRVESIWDRFAATPGRVKDGSNGLVACDHYHRWPEDFDIAQDIGLNAYRFSIAWPRIYTGEHGQPNQKGLDFYSRLVDGMLERGLQPWATLYHWDLPQTLQDAGGWENRATIDAFVDFADAMTRTLGDRVKHWITHNEPWCTAIIGNYEGWHAPGNTSLKTALQVAHNVLVSHGKATPVIRANVPDAQVGMAVSLHPLRAASGSPEDQAAMERHDGLRYRWFLDPLFGRGYPQATLDLIGDAAPDVVAGDMEAIAVKTDFMGVNYYFPEVVADAPDHAPFRARVLPTTQGEITAMGWPVAPEGLSELLTRIENDYHPGPMYVTENGSAFDDTVDANGEVDDVQRRQYLMRHLASLKDAIDNGVPVKGYFAWSLLDNFEWAEGYLKRFGLVHIDYETQQRRLKNSGKWYRAFLRQE